MKKIYFYLVLLIFFLGCSSKQYYEPNKIEGNFKTEPIIIPSYIQYINSNGATLGGQSPLPSHSDFGT